MSAEPLSPRAGEYVLGTLSGPERVQFEKELARDGALQAEVRFWQRRLAPLTGAVMPEEPSPALWAAIERSLDASEDQSPATDAGLVERLRRSVRFWRGATVGAGGLAAALAVTLLAGVLPRQPAARRDYLAVVDRGGELPALVVRVDLDRLSIQVRALNADMPAGRSLEVWYVGRGSKPLSLGIVSQSGAGRPLPAPLRDGTVEGSTIAVSAEPQGGSPTGAPTGPIVYSGKLIKAEP